MIFVCYRRADSQDATDRLCEHLRRAFGKQSIVRDVDTMPYGLIWLEYVRERIRACKVFLLVMGPEWSRILDDETGRPRISRRNDPVRLELEEARAAGVPILPVLVKHASPPLPSDLLPDLDWIREINIPRVRPDPDFKRDLKDLVATLRPYVGERDQDRELRTKAVGSAQPPLLTVEAVRKFAESSLAVHGRYHATLARLTDPRQVYVELRCQSEHDASSAEPNAVDGPSEQRATPTAVGALSYLREGIDDGKAQVILANLGMGKSHLALRVYQSLLDDYFRDPLRSRIPVLIPLRGYTLKDLEPDALEIVRAFLVLHGLLPVAEAGMLERLLRAGSLTIIFDGVDELALIHTDPDPRNVADVLDKLDLRRHGDCPWVATTRTGLFLAALAALREKRSYRLAHLLQWSESDWNTFVHKCQDVSAPADAVFDTDEQRDAFLSTIRSSANENLKQLTATPLLARMMVESWRTIMERPDDVNKIRLYHSYTESLLTGRGGSRPLSIETRRQCLESAAAFFFRSKRQTCSGAELVEIADAYLLETVARPDLVSTVMRELQTYSLLVANAQAGALSFAHASFREYFLALAIMRDVRARGWAGEGLLPLNRLDDGEAEFVAGLLGETENASLLAVLHELLHEDSTFLPANHRRNLLTLALSEARTRRKRVGHVHQPLAGADLREMDLAGLDFGGCALQGANLNGVWAIGANFHGASLLRCSLVKANLAGACFAQADLRESNLDFATLTGVEMSTRPPRLSGCRMRGATMHRDDADYFELIIRRDATADEAWRSKTIRMIRKGIVSSPQSDRPLRTDLLS